MPSSLSFIFAPGGRALGLNLLPEDLSLGPIAAWWGKVHGTTSRLPKYKLLLLSLLLNVCLSRMCGGGMCSTITSELSDCSPIEQ